MKQHGLVENIPFLPSYFHEYENETSILNGLYDSVKIDLIENFERKI